jgi:hypothetical protein
MKSSVGSDHEEEGLPCELAPNAVFAKAEEAYLSD